MIYLHVKKIDMLLIEGVYELFMDMFNKVNHWYDKVFQTLQTCISLTAKEWQIFI
jgi:hypothetical protein